MCEQGHSDLKISKTRLRAETTSNGPQLLGDEVLCYLRTCVSCGSTIALDPDVAREMQLADSEGSDGHTQ